MWDGVGIRDAVGRGINRIHPKEELSNKVVKYTRELLQGNTVSLSEFLKRG